MSALPQRPKGRPTAAANALYEGEIKAFCAGILEIQSRLDFQVGSRGWCYLLETDGVITKGEFNIAERLLVRCRKTGELPISICAEDDKRSPEGIEQLDEPDIEVEADRIIGYVHNAHQYYEPFSFWDGVDTYVEIATEKSDLKSLFARVAREFHCVIQNVGGWADLNVRAGMMRRFQGWEAKGKRCVLLYCGDHDPGGLQISKFLRENLEELAPAVGWSPKNLLIKRFGLDADFIEANRLTWIDNLETGTGKSLADPKHPDHFKPYVQTYLKHFGARKVEANALVAAPEAGRQLCREAILRYVPADALQKHEARLAAARRELRAALARRLTGDGE
jgi:hypothetical protein